MSRKLFIANDEIDVNTHWHHMQALLTDRKQLE